MKTVMVSDRISAVPLKNAGSLSPFDSSNRAARPAITNLQEADADRGCIPPPPKKSNSSKLTKKKNNKRAHKKTGWWEKRNISSRPFFPLSPLLESAHL